MTLAVCVMVKNCSRHIAEWIAYHLSIGFDAVIIQDNISSDETWKVVRSCKHMGRVILEPWHQNNIKHQNHCYEQVCQRYKDQFDWIAFIDDDEFIVSTSGESINGLLEICDEASAVGLNWLMFGSSGHLDIPAGLVLENFTRRGLGSFGPNVHIKSIVRPSTVKRCISPHGFDVEGRYVDYLGQDLVWNGRGSTLAAPNEPSWRVQHYFTRSRAHWVEKMNRGYGDPTVRTMQDFVNYDRNEVEDLSALLRVADVRRLLSNA